MRLLTVPNWSFGRDRDLLQLFESLLSGWGLTIHFLASDVDHNRTVTAFSGDAEVVFERLERLSEAAFERIDLNRHVGVHPRIGALDVCPFIRLDHSTSYPLALKIEAFGQRLAQQFGIPIYLYERSERGKHAGDLPTLRRGGFGGLQMQVLNPDFGPDHVHPRLGATVMGERGFLIALNANFHGIHLSAVKAIAKAMREARDAGDSRLVAVRALGLPLASRDQCQVSMNLTQPENTPVDDVLNWVEGHVRRHGLRSAGNELIGVIPESSVATASRVPIADQQIVRVVP